MQYSNNPFNIRYYKCNRWLGSLASGRDKFESFYKLEYGVRAFLLIVRSYYVNLHYRTIENIVFRFADKTQNKYNYLEYVLQFFEREIPLFNLATERNFYEISTKQELFCLAKSMALFETQTALSDDLLEKVCDYYHILNDKFPAPLYDACVYPKLSCHVS